MRLKTAAGLLACALAATALAAPAQASISSTDMRDTRYCEIFTVFLSPSPIAKVNNSYGLNNCRQGWWDSLDAGAIATESGADLGLTQRTRATG